MKATQEAYDRLRQQFDDLYGRFLLTETENRALLELAHQQHQLLTGRRIRRRLTKERIH